MLEGADTWGERLFKYEIGATNPPAALVGQVETDIRPHPIVEVIGGALLPGYTPK
jgi:hypothetical protein